MHPGLTLGPIVGLLVGFGVGAALSTFITRPTPSRVIRWVGIILCVASWLAYVGGVLYWRYNVEPFRTGSEGSGVGFGDIFIHFMAIIPALFLTGLAAAVFLIQPRCSVFPSSPKHRAESGPRE